MSHSVFVSARSGPSSSLPIARSSAFTASTQRARARRPTRSTQVRVHAGREVVGHDAPAAGQALEVPRRPRLDDVHDAEEEEAGRRRTGAKGSAMSVTHWPTISSTTTMPGSLRPTRSRDVGRRERADERRRSRETASWTGHGQRGHRPEEEEAHDRARRPRRERRVAAAEARWPRARRAIHDFPIAADHTADRRVRLAPLERPAQRGAAGPRGRGGARAACRSGRRRRGRARPARA